MRRAGTVVAAVGHGPGDHLCWFHDGESAWQAVACSFLEDGARAHDRLLYLADKDARRLIDDLAGLPDRDAMLRTGQLRVLPLAEAYRAGHRFVAAEAEAARAAGYRALRFAADASPLVTNPDDARRFAAYELHLDGLAASAGLSGLCGYDNRVVTDDAAPDLCFVHPLRHADRCDALGALYAGDGGRWRLTGEVDLSCRQSLEAALSVVPRGADLHLDLRDLTFIDVGGTRALVSFGRRLAPHRLVLHDPPDVLRLVLATGWDELPCLDVVTS